jgi:hypothetical protein
MERPIQGPLIELIFLFMVGQDLLLSYFLGVAEYFESLPNQLCPWFTHEQKDLGMQSDIQMERWFPFDCSKCRPTSSLWLNYIAT